jgi:hypothetical protein
VGPRAADHERQGAGEDCRAAFLGLVCSFKQQMKEIKGMRKKGLFLRGRTKSPLIKVCIKGKRLLIQCLKFTNFFLSFFSSGKKGLPEGGIKPNTVLVFEIELAGINM